jgi:hypothetical protein
MDALNFIKVAAANWAKIGRFRFCLMHYHLFIAAFLEVIAIICSGENTIVTDWSKGLALELSSSQRRAATGVSLANSIRGSSFLPLVQNIKQEYPTVIAIENLSGQILELYESVGVDLHQYISHHSTMVFGQYSETPIYLVYSVKLPKKESLFWHIYINNEAGQHCSKLHKNRLTLDQVKSSQEFKRWKRPNDYFYKESAQTVDTFTALLVVGGINRSSQRIGLTFSGAHGTAGRTEKQMEPIEELGYFKMRSDERLMREYDQANALKSSTAKLKTAEAALDNILGDLRLNE